MERHIIDNCGLMEESNPCLSTTTLSGRALSHEKYIDHVVAAGGVEPPRIPI